MTGTGSTLEQTVEWAKEHFDRFYQFSVRIYEDGDVSILALDSNTLSLIRGSYVCGEGKNFNLDAALADWRQKAEKWLQEHDQSDTK